MRRLITKVLPIILLLYFLLISGIYLFQDKLLFHPERISKEHIERGDKNYEEINLQYPSGLEINSQLIKTKHKSNGVIYFLHGNRGNIASQKIDNDYYLQRGYDIYMIDYQGYGKSEGVISKKALETDAELGYNYLTKRYPSDSIIIHGHSLGSYPASYLASNKQAKFLLLSAPIYKVEDIITMKFPFIWLPFEFRTNLDNSVFIKQIKMPIHILSSKNDHMIPYESSMKFKNLLKTSDSFTEVTRGGHNSLLRDKKVIRKLDDLLGSPLH